MIFIIIFVYFIKYNAFLLLLYHQMSFTNQIMNHQAYTGTDIVQKCKKYS